MLDQGRETIFVSVYGPTETTCICSITEVSEKEMASEAQYISIGRFPTFFTTSLHSTFHLDSGDIAGELVLGGINVSSGYIQPRNSEGKFVKIPSEVDGTFNYYLTGDLVYFSRELGSYCFLGRKDNQIKRSGVRIELEEIESRLEKVSGTVVLADYQSERVADLCLLFVKTDKVNVDVMEKCCRETLTSHMIPRRIIGVDQIPLNANGKKNRRLAKEQLNSILGDKSG
jgi:D-alanine--poly(phosphoribitol) ligase subunit 1